MKKYLFFLWSALLIITLPNKNVATVVKPSALHHRIKNSATVIQRRMNVQKNRENGRFTSAELNIRCAGNDQNKSEAGTFELSSLTCINKDNNNQLSTKNISLNLEDTAHNRGIIISASGPVTFCHGDSVVLTLPPGNSYLWSNGATTQSITITNGGTYSAAVDGYSATNTVEVLETYCQVEVHLKLFLQGFYIGNQTMRAVLDPVHQPGICDSIKVQLIDSIDSKITDSKDHFLNTNGEGIFLFQGLIAGHNYYLFIQHRNHLAVWSKHTYLFKQGSPSIDFTVPQH